MSLGVLIAKDLRRRWRDPKALILQLLVPFVITAVMGRLSVSEIAPEQ